jgi:hypothetical protein
MWHSLRYCKKKNIKVSLGVDSINQFWQCFSEKNCTYGRMKMFIRKCFRTIEEKMSIIAWSIFGYTLCLNYRHLKILDLFCLNFFSVNYCTLIKCTPGPYLDRRKFLLKVCVWPKDVELVFPNEAKTFWKWPWNQGDQIERLFACWLFILGNFF